MSFTRKTLASTLILSQLVGCAGYQTVRGKVDQEHTEKSEAIADLQKSVAAYKPVPLVRTSNQPWVASRSVTREKTDSFPAIFDHVTLRFGGRHTIASVAEIIYRATGIKVMVHPDVFVSQRALIPRAGGTFTPSSTASSSTGTLSSAVGPGSSGPSMISTAPAGMGSGMGAAAGSIQSTSGGDYLVDVPVNYSGPLNEFLDQVAIRLGVDWEFKDGRIEIRRFMTRSFTVLAMPGKNEFSSSLGKQGGLTTGNQTTGTGSQSSSSGSFSSDMKIATSSSIDYWASIEGGIKAMLSPMGKIAVNQGTGTVTVTDIRDVVERIGAMIEEENRALTRQVSFEVQVYSVRSNDGADFGVDWNLVYQKLSNLSPEFGLSLVSPANLASTLAGQVGVQILKTPSNDNGTLDRLSGSTAFLKALAEVGKLSRVTTQRTITLNRRAVAVAVTNQVAYVAATQPGVAAAGAAGATTPGLTPGTVTTGFIMNLTPTITDRNSMVLSFSVDISDLLKMATFTSGSGATAQSVQQPEVSSTQFAPNVALQTGDTLVLTGFERVTNNYDQRTLNRDGDPGLGGSFSGNTTKESLVVMIKAVIREGI